MSQPRVFSLQRLVEVADFNMDMRGRIVWAKVWHMVERHFTGESVRRGIYSYFYVSTAPNGSRWLVAYRLHARAVFIKTV